MLGGGQVFAGKRPEPVRLNGPGSKYTPTVNVTFVRRKNPAFGTAWPGEVYDPVAAQKMYTEKIRKTGAGLGMKVDVRPEPIYSLAEADRWLAEAKESKPDGLMVVLAYPGFHQLFVYGNHRDALVDFGRLQKIEPEVV